MNTRNKFKRALAVLGFGILAMAFNSCTLFNLELQEDYEFKGRVPDPNINMTAMEYIESRKQEKFATLYQAITLLNMEDEYRAANRTYIMMSDLCFSSFLRAQSPRVSNVLDLNRDYLRNVLRGQIIKGEYPSTSLTTTPVEVETLSPTTLLYLSLRDAGIYEAEKYQVRINNVPASTKPTTVTTSNIKATNGYIHVIDYTYSIMSK